MSDVFNKTQGVKIEFVPCPFCGGTAEWVMVPGEDFIMRCSVCHASTSKARYSAQEAAADWDAHDIVDDHYTITSDTKIDHFLKSGIQTVLFSEYSNFEEFPQFEGGFLCSKAVIITSEIILVINRVAHHLFYDEISNYTPKYNDKLIAPKGTEIKFARSKWRKRNLISLEFRCGNTRVTIESKTDMECLFVCEKEINDFEDADNDWRFSVVGNITKTHTDDNGVLRYGSSAFRGGAKVYLCGKYWSKEQDTIGVIGFGRGKRYVFSDVPTDLIENVRCQIAHHPAVLALMSNWEFHEDWWGKSAEDKNETKRFVDDWNG